MTLKLPQKYMKSLNFINFCLVENSLFEIVYLRVAISENIPNCRLKASAASINKTIYERPVNNNCRLVIPRGHAALRVFNKEKQKDGAKESLRRSFYARSAMKLAGN